MTMTKTILQRVQAIADASISPEQLKTMAKAQVALCHLRNPDALARVTGMARNLRGLPEPAQDAILTLIEALVVGPKVAT